MAIHIVAGFPCRSNGIVDGVEAREFEILEKPPPEPPVGVHHQIVILINHQCVEHRHEEEHQGHIDALVGSKTESLFFLHLIHIYMLQHPLPIEHVACEQTAIPQPQPKGEQQ